MSPNLPDSTSSIDDDLVYIGDSSKKLNLSLQTEPLKIQIANTEVGYSPKCDETILDVLLDAGVDAPYSCKSGVCMSCIAVIEEGCVTQDDLAALSDEDLSERKALLCQSRPASSSVRIKFLE